MRTQNQCAKKIFPISQTHTSWIAATLAVKSKHCHLRLKEVLLAVDLMANGLAQDHHHGRMEIGDMRHKIVAHPVLTGISEVEVAMTDDLPTNTEQHLVRLENDDQTGAMELMLVMEICLHHLAKAATLFLMCLAMGLMVAIEEGRDSRDSIKMTSIFLRTTAHVAHVSQTTDNDEARGILEIPVKALAMTGLTGVEGLETDQETRETLVVSAETDAHGPGARSDVTGTGTTGMTSTDGDEFNQIGSCIGIPSVFIQWAQIFEFQASGITRMPIPLDYGARKLHEHFSGAGS